MFIGLIVKAQSQSLELRLSKINSGHRHRHRHRHRQGQRKYKFSASTELGLTKLSRLIQDGLATYLWSIKDQLSYLNKDQDPKPQSGTSSIQHSPKWGLTGHWGSLHFQNQYREPKFGSLAYQRPVTISKSKSRCLNPSQEPPVSSKAPNQD